MIKIDKARAIELFEQVIAEAGPGAGYEFPNGEGGGCLYVHRYNEDSIMIYPMSEVDYSKLEPGCIVGRALINAGVPIEKIDWDFEGAFSLHATDLLRNRGLADVTNDAQQFMRAVQSLQDRGVGWSDSLALSLLEHAL